MNSIKLIVCFFLLLSGIVNVQAQDKQWHPIGEMSQEEYSWGSHLVEYNGKLVILDRRPHIPEIEFGFWSENSWEYQTSSAVGDSNFKNKAIEIGNFKGTSTLFAYKTVNGYDSSDGWSYFHFNGITWEKLYGHESFPDYILGSISLAKKEGVSYSVLIDTSKSWISGNIYISTKINSLTKIFDFPTYAPPKLRLIDNSLYFISDYMDFDSKVRSEFPVLLWNGNGEYEIVGKNELGCLPRNLIKFNGQLIAAGDNYLKEEGGTIYRLVDSTWEAFGHKDFNRITQILTYKDDIIARVGSPGFDKSNEIWRYNNLTGWSLIDAPNNRFGNEMVIIKDEVFIEFEKLVNPNGDTLYNIASLPLLNDVNLNPTANPDSYDVGNGTLKSLKVTANDTDMNQDYLLVSIISQPSNGTATVNSLDEIEFRADRTFTGTEEFEYRICDRGGLCDSTTVTLTVIEENSAPITVMDTVRLARLNETYQIDVLANDQDAEEDDLVLTTVSSPNFGDIEIINAGNLLSFNSGNSFWDVQRIEYTVCDEFNACSNEQLTLILDSTFVGIEGKGNSQIIEARIYPNPANQELNVIWEGEKDNNLNIAIYNALGNLVVFEPFNNNDQKINISHLPNGLYQVKLQEESKGTIATEKIIIIN